MIPASFFSLFSDQEGDEAVHESAKRPVSAAAASPSSGARSTTAAATTSTATPSKMTFSRAAGGFIPVENEDAHFSLPKRRPGASGTVELPAHDAADGGSDRPHMLKEWCGIMYYSCRDVTLSGYRKVCNATVAGMKRAAFEEEKWSFFHDGGPCGDGAGPFWRCHRLYTSLATTRTCSWMLPGSRDAPLVLHMAVIFLGLEAIQATSFFLRYRQALRKTEEALAEAEAAAEAEEEVEEADESNNNNNNDNDDDSVHGDRTGRGGSEMSAQRTARARLPRGSSRSMHRLCSYWALIERAVRQAPEKHAGVPTTAAELGRYFGADSTGGNEECDAARDGRDDKSHARPPASGTSDGASKRFTSDGIPHGAEKVMVLTDEHTFPVFHRSYDYTDSAATTANATVASSMDAISPLDLTGDTERIGTSAAASPPQRALPPMHPAPNAPMRQRSPGFTTPPPAAVVIEEVAQPWQVFHALWTDTVRYSVNYTEIRQLLLGCNVAEVAKLFEDSDDEAYGGGGGGGGSRTARDRVFHHLWRSMSHISRQPSMEALSNGSDANVDSPLHNSAAASFSARCLTSPSSQTAASPRYTDGRVCVVCMALTWYLALIREVYEAVVVYQDVQRCADALDELEEYQRAIFQRGVEVGAGFFEEVLRCAQHTAEECGSDHTLPSGSGSRASQDRDRGAGSPRPLLLPQVDGGDDGGEDAAHDIPVNRPSFPPLLPRDESSQRRGLPNSNPLALDSSSSPTASFPSQPDRCPCVVTLRGASPLACWAELTAALAALLRRRRLMELACVRSLFSYMYTGSAAKIVSFTILALLTSLSSRVSALGQATREAISSNLDTYYRNAARDNGCGSSGASGGGCGRSSGCSSNSNQGGTPAGQRVLALFAFECTRLAVNTVLAKTTHEYITLAASQRRNTVKAELYEALTRMPLAFFDLHSYDEVEQIVYYVNDIEGVEVHVHNYLCGLITSLFAMQHAMRQLPWRARVLVGFTVAASLTVKYVGQKVTTWTQTAQRTGGVLPPWLRGCGLDGTLNATAELDAQVEENMESNARQGGVMLRGLDIVAVLPQLRPYAADLSLMRWWTDHTRIMGAASGSTEAATLTEGLMVLPRQLYGKMLPALGGAMMTFADWVLPTVVSSYGASMAFSGVDALSLSNRLIEAMRCVGDTVDTLVDARRVAEVVLLNAYKANVLDKVLDQRRWEPTTMDYMKTFSYGVDETAGEDADEKKGEASSSTHMAGEAPDALAGSQRHSSGRLEGGGNASTLHQQALGKSFRRSSSSHLSMGSRCWRRLTFTAAWMVAHSPPALMVHGTLYAVRRGLRFAGFAPQDVRGPSALAGAGLDNKGELGRLHRRRRRGRRGHHHHHQRHARRSPTQQPPQPLQPSASESATANLPSPFLKVGRFGSGMGSVSDGNRTEAYDSDAPADSGQVDVSSLSSFSESETTSCDADEDYDSDMNSEAAAAAAAAALVNATVHAVTVQNLQFYYPTAPTVPVFPEPITCSFTLQDEASMSPLLSSFSSQSESLAMDQLRGRLVCLVGPSGHGKSTLLSLLLGMYTHYSTPGQRGCAAPFTSPSPASANAELPTHSESDEADTVSFGSPRLADQSTLPCLPADIVLTLRMPGPARRHGRGTSRGVSSAYSEAEVLEELPVSVIPRDILRGNLFSFVPQSPVIFSGATIAHNISLENFVSLEQEELLAEIAQCAAWAHCEYIQRFPQGLMTYIADSGTGAWSSSLASGAAAGGGTGGGGGMVRLSGGQAQRLMMARALFHGRRGGTVLVMDEPTASLDHEVKMEIVGEWRELLDKGIVRGMICATHDADLIDVADEIVRLP